MQMMNFMLNSDKREMYESIKTTQVQMSTSTTTERPWLKTWSFYSEAD
jgi:hypothetical protein